MVRISFFKYGVLGRGTSELFLRAEAESFQTKRHYRFSSSEVSTEKVLEVVSQWTEELLKQSEKCLKSQKGSLK